MYVEYDVALVSLLLRAALCKPSLVPLSHGQDEDSTPFELNQLLHKYPTEMKRNQTRSFNQASRRTIPCINTLQDERQYTQPLHRYMETIDEKNQL